MSNVTVQEALKAAIEGLESAESIINEISIVMVKFGVSPEKIGLGRESKLMPIARQCKAALAEIDKCEPVAWMHKDIKSGLFEKPKSSPEQFIPLYAAPTVQREGWVSVEDATPDYSGTQKRVRVLVYWKDTKTVFTLWYGLRFGLKEPEFYEENEWTESNDGEINESDNLYLGEYLSFKNITHWQYLPAAPKE